MTATKPLVRKAQVAHVLEERGAIYWCGPKTRYQLKDHFGDVIPACQSALKSALHEWRKEKP